jgi:hypothetical protein
MNGYRNDPRRRELLVRRALEGLNAAEASELRGRGGEPECPDAYELAAAAAHLALLSGPRPPLPSALRRRIEATARTSIMRSPESEPPRS